MAAKAVLVFCATQVQSAYSQCIGNGYAPFGGFNAGLGYGGLGFDGAGFSGCGVASTGGGLPCASASPIPPAGMSVLSENVYEGALAVGGNLPFLGTIALEGVLPTAGAGAISYGCGASSCGIAVEEGPIVTGIAPSVGYGTGFAGYGGLAGAGYGTGLAGAGFNELGYGGFGCINTRWGALTSNLQIMTDSK